MTHVFTFIVGVLSSIAAALVLRHAADRYSSHIGFRRVMKDVISLFRAIQKDDYIPDEIIGVDRNGSIVASILSGYIGFRPVMVIATRTIHHADSPREVNLSTDHLPGEGAFCGKKVLVVCCYVDTGSALEVVYNYLYSLPTPPSEIRTAAIYTTPSPRLKPRYFIHELGKDMKVSIDRVILRMPWIKEDWKLAPRGKKV